MYFSFTIFCKRKKWQSIPLIRLFLFCVSFFQYRILSPYASPQEFIEDSRKEVIATLQAAGYQLPSSENVAVKEWSGLLLKFILKADEINRHLCFLYRNRNIICSGLGYLSSYPIPNLSMPVPKMLDSFVDESSRTSE